MLRSLKNSLKSGKSKSSHSPKDEGPAAVSNSSSKQQHQASSSVKQPAAAGPKQQGQAVKEKPPLPAISDASLQLYYAEALPSFREYPGACAGAAGGVRGAGAAAWDPCSPISGLVYWSAVRCAAG
jgi:hypothetical protein